MLPLLLALVSVEPAPYTRLIDAHLPQDAISSDEIFFRRISVDLWGSIPSAEETRSFLRDRRPDKRERWARDMLVDPRAAKRFATLWSQALLPELRARKKKRVSQEKFSAWLAEGFIGNRSFAEVAYDLLTATGGVDDNPAASFILARNDSARLAADVSRLFLASKIECAQCHDHPDAPFTKADFAGFSAFFARTKKRRVPGGPRYARVIVERPRGQLTDDDLTPVIPRFIDGTTIGLGPGRHRRRALAELITREREDLFAQAVTNRMWSMLIGHPLVEPLDDLSIEPSRSTDEKKLLDALSRNLIDSGFQMRALIEGIVLSRAYQRSEGMIRPMTNLELGASLARALVPGDVRQSRLRRRFLRSMRGMHDGPSIDRSMFFLGSGRLEWLIRRRARQLREGPDPLEEAFVGTIGRSPSASERRRFERIAPADLLWVLVSSTEFQTRP